MKRHFCLVIGIVNRKWLHRFTDDFSLRESLSLAWDIEVWRPRVRLALTVAGWCLAIISLGALLS